MAGVNHPIRLVVVDDAVVVRGLLSRILDGEQDIDLIGTASNGEEAIALAGNLHPDVMLLDIEMPQMDGLTALPIIRQASPHTRVIILSAQTRHDAAISLKALELGASEVLAKADNSQSRDDFSRELLATIRGITRGNMPEYEPQADNTLHYPNTRPHAVAFAASTGGPQALQTIMKGLEGALANIPIFITQHMPATFTSVLSQNLSAMSTRMVHEARDGQQVVGGQAYLAPGDYHMILQRSAEPVITLHHGPRVHYCRPAADPMITSLIQHYGDALLLVVLSGMGQDGLAGARALHSLGGSIITQDKASSAVWGMPKAVTEAGIALATLPDAQIAPYLITACNAQ